MLSLLKRLLKNRRGATAVEFALLAPLVFMALFAIIEISLMFATSVIVEGAMQNAARQIRTGQAQQSGNALTTFTNTVCTSLYGFFDCNDLYYDVRSFSSFSTISMPIVVDEDGIPQVQFSAGGSGTIIAVRAIFYYNFYTPMIGSLFQDNSGANRRLLSSTVVFRNEPYDE